MSDGSLSTKLRAISGLEFPDHSYLRDGDSCAYFGEYTPAGTGGRPAYSLSSANQLLCNLKIPLSQQNRRVHKDRAIETAARLIVGGLTPEVRANYVLVPVPPSKPPGDPEFDDRMRRVCQAASPERTYDVLSTQVRRIAAHETTDRPTPDQLMENIAVDHRLLGILPGPVLLVDDMITTGASFRACKLLLQAIRPIEVYGLFITRRVPVRVSWDDFDFDNL